MDSELIRKIVEEIVTSKILLNWRFYGIELVLLIIAFLFYSFVRPYLTKKGEQLARRSDINAVLEELRKTTRLTEEIRANIEKEIWIKKEFNILRRQKLEELLVWLYEYKDRIYAEMQEKMFAGKPTGGVNPLDRATAIHKLYFPELDGEMSVLYLADAAFSQWLVDGMEQRIEDVKGGKEFPVLKDNHIGKFGERYKLILSSIRGVEDKAKVVMNELRSI
ncbi:MAG: hypothetical protein ACLQGU_10565 [bacterium]